MGPMREAICETQSEKNLDRLARNEPNHNESSVAGAILRKADTGH